MPRTLFKVSGWASNASEGRYQWMTYVLAEEATDAIAAATRKHPWLGALGVHVSVVEDFIDTTKENANADDLPR